MASSCGANPPEALVAGASPAIVAAGDGVTAPDVTTGAVVQVDASESSDADATSCGLAETLTYAWSFDLLPPGSTTSLNDAVLTPSFVADVPGTYRVRLTVTDATGRSDSATFTVTAEPCIDLSLPSGFLCTTVKAGNAQGLDRPQGVTVDGSGNLYVVNNGLDEIVRITSAGSLTTFASSSVFSGGPTLEDIVFNTATGFFFVTDSGNDEIVRLSTGASATVFATAATAPVGIANFTTCASQNRLVVAAEGDDCIRLFDPSAAPTASSLMCDDMVTSGGTQLAISPRGVAASCNSSTNRIFATKTGGTDSLVRDTADVTATVNAAVTLSSSALMSDARDVVLTPCTTPKLVVASRGASTVSVVDNCSGSCTTTAIVSGLDEPWGLWFESATSLLVTDRATDTLFRITGSFCSL